MRLDNEQFTIANRTEIKEPRYVIEISFDDAYTDLYYLTSHPVTSLSGSNVIDDCIQKISGTTQKLNPDKANSTIGSINVSAIDSGLTDLQKTKLDNDYGLRGKRVRFYVGYAGLSWGDYILAQTQIIESVNYLEGVYTFHCADIQREMRKDIFEAKQTALAQSVTKDDTVINVYNTAQFEMVQHPASPSGLTDAPGQKVGYIKIEDNDQFEIIRYTGQTSASFTGCTRGVLGTRPIEVNKTSDSNIDNAPKVTEYIYLEMPAVKLAYALLTGSIYGEAGEFLPDHWHLGISTDFIKTTDFINIGAGWWNTSNDDLGVAAVVKTTKKVDGKKFIEEQIYRMLGAYSPVYATGELGLKRMTVVHSNGGFVRRLNETNVVKYGTLKHDMKSVINRILLKWNWVEQKEAFSRLNVLIDPLSITRHGKSDILELKFTTLEGSRHSYTTIKSRFDSIRDRYAGPPLKIDLTLTPDQNDLEVGDIVRVNLQNVKDYTGQVTTLDRNFEVQQVSTDWISGEVKVSLFGSSQRASALTNEGAAGDNNGQQGNAIGANYWVSAGTEINAANFPGAVSSAGGITSITGNINLTGHDDVNNASAIYYCNEDLTINGGVTVSTTKNTQIKVNGFFQINGTINAKEVGNTGGLGHNAHWDSVNYPANSPTWLPTPGFIGSNSSQPGTFIFAEYGMPGRLIAATSYTSSKANNISCPPMDVTVSADTLLGLESDLRGMPGGGGGAVIARVPDGVFTLNDNDYNAHGAYSNKVLSSGGTGGTGGGGLAIICKGCDLGINGVIDVSGGDGSMPTPYSNSGYSFYPGKGAGGAPGAVYFFIMDHLANAPTINDSNFKAYYGSSDSSSYSTEHYLIGAVTNATDEDDSDFSAILGVQPNNSVVENRITRDKYANSNSIITSFAPYPDHTVNNFEEHHRIQFVSGVIDPIEDTGSFADEPVTFTLTEYPDTPKSPAANLSSIEVSVTPPTDPNYRYGQVEFRVTGTIPWITGDPASNESVLVVPSDGTSYDIRVRSVSQSGQISPSGPIKSITVTDVINTPSQGVVDGVAPLVAVTIALEGGGAVFGGRDAKFTWDDTNQNLLYFREYQVEILDTGTNVVRTETITTPFYVYTYEKNAEDYFKENAVVGIHRQFTIRVTVIGRVSTDAGQQVSPQSTLSVSNTAPGLPTNLSILAGFKIITVQFDVPADDDYKETRVWMGTSTGFTVDDSTLVAVNYGGPIVIGNLNDGTEYFVRMRTYDTFGPGTLSSEFNVTTQSLGSGDIGGLSPWATVTTVDKDFIDANMDNNAIDSTKIVKLVASKIVTGTLAATEKISVDGQVESLSGSYVVAMGPKSITGGVALLSFLNGSTPIFALFEDGTAEFNGKVIVTAGSNVEVGATLGATWGSNITGQPSDAALLNSNQQWADITGANKPSDNATVGATWGTDLNSIPARLADTPSTGLNLTASYLGYYNGTSWNSYLDNLGRFYLNAGAGDNYLSWNGTTLTVRGDIEATTVAANSITATHIVASTITATEINDSAVTTDKINTNAVTASSSATVATIDVPDDGDIVSITYNHGHSTAIDVIVMWGFLGVDYGYGGKVAHLLNDGTEVRATDGSLTRHMYVDKISVGTGNKTIKIKRKTTGGWQTYNEVFLVIMGTKR